MRRFFGFVLITAGMIQAFGSAAAAEDVASALDVKTSSAQADAVQDILFLSPRRPFLIRLHLYVKGKGFRDLRRQWADSLFAKLDVDQNGALEGDELKQIPRPEMASSGTIQASVDLDPADGKVSRNEFQRYLMLTSGTPFSIISSNNNLNGINVVFAGGMNPNAQVDLFPKIDTNRDGKLSRQEVEATAANLKRYDRNEDDIVDSGELQQALPEELSMSQQQLSGALGLLMVVDTADGGIVVSRRLLEMYDKNSRDPVAKLFRKDEKLSLSELPIESDAYKLADQNGDGKLDRKELGVISSSMTPSVELEIQSPSSDGTLSVTSLRPIDPANVALIDLQIDSNGNKILKVNEASFMLRTARPPENGERDLRETYTMQFAQFDRDKNDYLELRELQQSGFPETFFARADTDSDGKVFNKEYLAEIERQIGLSTSSFSLEVTSDGVSLFRLVDTSPQDGRLSLRELAEVTEKLLKTDSNGDGFISLNELAIQLEGTFKAGVARVDGPARGPLGAQRRVTARTQSNQQNRSDAAPEWFMKMDRNGDRDLSRREFLGRKALFDKIDKNGDGLISIDEAKQAHDEATENKDDPPKE